MKIVIIEDDPEIAEAISFSFKVGWPEIKTITTTDGQKGIELVEEESPDLIVLDINLPDINGFEVIKQVRLFSSVPILVLTVRVDEYDVVKAFELGVDEYVVKPFRQMELLARAKCLIRGHGLLKDKQVTFFGEIKLDSLKRKLTCGNREIDLTNIECLIMLSLIRQAPNVVTSQKLIEDVWGDSDYPEAIDRLKVHIRHLRIKIEKVPSKPEIIQTRLGIGYIITKTSQ